MTPFSSSNVFLEDEGNPEEAQRWGERGWGQG